jgi:hypothetical protein
MFSKKKRKEGAVKFFVKRILLHREMDQREVVYFVVLTIPLLASSFLPTDALMLLDHILMRIAVILLLLYLIHVGPTVGIMGLLVVGVLYMERNRRKVEVAAKKWDAMDVHQPSQATVEEASTPQRTVPVASFDTPAGRESAFLPEEEMDISVFEPVGESIQQKQVLEGVYPLSNNAKGSGAADLFEQLGMGHVAGVETLGAQ